MSSEIDNNLFEWLNGKKAGPVTMTIHPTNICNLSCRFCGLANSKKNDKNQNFNQELNKEKWLNLIKEAYHLGVRECLIAGGGEPLCRSDVTLSIMKELKKFKICGELITNGTLFNERTIKEIICMDWDLIKFSLEAPDAKTHDYLVGVNGAFQHVKNTIKKFDYWKQKLKKENPRLILWPVLMNKNYNKFIDMIKFAYVNKLNLIHISPLIVDFEECNELKLSQFQKNKFINDIEKIREKKGKYNVEIECTDIDSGITEIQDRRMLLFTDKDITPQNNFLSTPCFEPWYSIFVNAEGYVGPCCVFSFTDNKELNVLNHNLEEIWYGEFFSDFRNQILNRKFNEKCSSCNLIGKTLPIKRGLIKLQLEAREFEKFIKKCI